MERVGRGGIGVFGDEGIDLIRDVLFPFWIRI